MTEWKWKGSRWWKFDLHTHTPASDDYGKGASQTTLSSTFAKIFAKTDMALGPVCA